MAGLLAEVSPGVLADVLTGWLAGPLTGWSVAFRWAESSRGRDEPVAVQELLASIACCHHIAWVGELEEFIYYPIINLQDICEWQLQELRFVRHLTHWKHFCVDFCVDYNCGLVVWRETIQISFDKSDSFVCVIYILMVYCAGLRFMYYSTN